MRPSEPRGVESQAYRRAQALFRDGRLRDARDACIAALRSAPPEAPMVVLLGRILTESGHWTQARDAFSRALAIDSANPDAWLGLAHAEARLGRSAESLEIVEKILSFNALNPEIHAVSAAIALAAGDAPRAASLATIATRLEPTLAAGWFNLALALQRQQRIDDARAAARRAAALDRHDAATAGLAAQLDAEAGDLVAARATIASALASHPRHPGLLAQSASIATRSGDSDGAIEAHERLLALHPDDGPSLSQLVFARKSALAWQGLDALQQQFRAGVAAHRPGLTPFSFLSDPSTRAEQRACAATWSQSFMPAAPPAADLPLPAASSRRLRLGYLSADFFQHPTAVLVAGVIEAHDRDRVEVFAYSTGPDDGSPLRGRLTAAAEHFVDVRGLAPDALAGRMRADALDVLIDLKGHTDGAATAALALRPAPLQAHWVGYPGTLGARYVDYLFADRIVVPAEHARDYSETLVWLPHAYQPNDRRREAAAMPSRASLGLPDRAIVLAGFNAPWKLNAAVFDAWARVLAAVPDAVLWLLARGPDDPLRQHACREFAARGVAAARLVFTERRAEPDYLALFGHADMLLDTWPYNAHTTASDALWMQCPVVTWLGDTFAGRVGASLNAAVGIAELVAHDVEGYVALATALARDPQRRRQLRQRLLLARTGSPLFDAEAMARNVESALVRMVEQRRSGIRENFDVVHA